MKNNIKTLDWVVSFYCGYISLRKMTHVFFLFILLWICLFVIWAMLENKINLQFWRWEQYQKADFKILTVSLLAIIGNLIYRYIERKNATWESAMIVPNLFVVMATVIAEELLFRESIFTGIERCIGAKRVSKKQGDTAKCQWMQINSMESVSKGNLTIFLSSILFSSAHILNYWFGYRIKYLIVQVVVSFIMGILLGIMRLHFGRLKECIWIHLLFNLVSYL